MSRIKVVEPVVNNENYVSSLSAAFNWYNQEKDKKDARVFLKDYITQHFTKNDVKVFEKLPDSKISTTYAWISRMVLNGSLTLREGDHIKFSNYLKNILVTSEVVEEEIKEEKISRPSVRDNMEEKVKEYLGELESALDIMLLEGKELVLFNDLKGRSVPQPYCSYIEEFIKKKASEFISVYESNDSDIKEGYSNIGKRKLTQIIKMLGSWTEDIEKYSQFKKANRKPRVKKAKPPAVQVAKLKYKKEDSELSLRSVVPSEMIGSSQVWVYNTKNKRLAVYRSESSSGIQVKGSSLQNYDPDLSEQKTLRKPKEVLKEALTAGKVQLRRLVSELSTKDVPVTGRINEECIILRVIK